MKTYEQTAAAVAARLTEEKKRRARRLRGALAAVFTLVVAIGAAAAVYLTRPAVTPPVETDPAQTLPAPETVDAEPAATRQSGNETEAPIANADMMAFVVHNGVVYHGGQLYYHADDWNALPMAAKKNTAYVNNGETDPRTVWYAPFLLTAAQYEALRGSYVGTAAGSVTCWNASEKYAAGYGEMDGSVAGDVYTVAGYDEAQYLCIFQDMDWSDPESGAPEGAVRAVMLFTAANVPDDETGAALFGDRMHLERTAEWAWCTHGEWNAGLNHFALDENAPGATARRDVNVTEETKAAFLRALCDAPLSRRAFPGVDETLLHLWLTQPNGTVAELRLFPGGLVLCPESWSSGEAVYEQLDPEGPYAEILAATVG